MLSAIAGDVTRRAVICRLDTGLENPETREFAFDCLQMAKQRRTQYVAGALTALRGFITAGRPVKVSAFGSFSDYSLVRGTLIWLGEEDPVATRAALTASDPRRAEIIEVVSTWAEAVGSEPLTLAELKTCCEEINAGPAKKKLLGLLRDRTGGYWNARKVGWWLRSFKGRPFNGHTMKSEQAKDRQVWWIEATNQPNLSPAPTQLELLRNWPF
jgi:putative DNA primase/helicase